MKGVGPKKAALLASELGIRTPHDLLFYFPFRYSDRSTIISVSQIESENVAIQLIGTIEHIREAGDKFRKRLTAIFRDESGTIELVWFKGIKQIQEYLKPNTVYILYGKPSLYKGRYTLQHPEIEPAETARIAMGSTLKPVYNTTEKCAAAGLNSNGIAKLTKTAIEELFPTISDNLPVALRKKFKLMDRGDALRQVHLPTDAEQLELARRRLKFEELFYLQVEIVKNKMHHTRLEHGALFQKVGDLFHTFYNTHLPFELTGAQKRVMKEIRSDVARGQHMNRLIQGDVGSGKTMIAVLSALIAIDNGYQACLMAPTEILAQQHFHGIAELLNDLPIQVGMLTGSTPKGERKIILEMLLNGQLHLLIGTHALIEPWVQFQKLGLCIIDEQHRFGVMQRAALWKKAELPPHVLVMTATPIPRTLAMTIYGDLDVSVIDELPPGRKPITTWWKSDSRREEVFAFLEKEIALGRQVYIVYPLIEESEAMDYKDLQDGYESIARRFPLPRYAISIVHGKMKSEARDIEMDRFIRGETQIMVATTVIEVGVNVPNASVMVIESAERFGLSQLHQLRGRVGRGAEQSYCILMTGHKLSAEGKIRMETMVRTTDGFEISETDLQLRGPGDLSGTQQSGIVNLKIADLAKDQRILSAARETALEIFDRDPYLEYPENALIRNELELRGKQKSDLSKIS